MEKFVSADAWNNWQNDVTDDEAKKAESGSKPFIDTYSGPLTVTKAQLKFDDKAKGDDNFFKFVVSVETPQGATRDIVLFYSFKTFKYGAKGALIFAVKLKSLFRALGFEDLSISGKDGQEAARVQKKYLGGWDENGCLPRWVGLQFQGTFAYKDGSYHIKRIGEQFHVVDSNGNPAVFPSLKRFNEVTNDYEQVSNATLSGASRDTLKGIAGASGIALAYSELVRQEPLRGANDALLAVFEPGYVAPVKAAGKLDAHAHTSEGDEDADLFA